MNRLLLRALVGVCFSLAISLGTLRAQDAGKPPAAELVKAEAPSDGVELLAGVAAGRLEVKIIPKNDREARLLIKNLSNQPISVRLPDAVAARPALAQFRANGRNGGRNGGGNRANAAPQNVGVPPMNGPAGRNGNNFFGNPMLGPPRNGFFNIPPERDVDVKIDIVCLEHGKKDPRAQIPYELCRLDEVTAAPGVRGILRRLGDGSLDQRSSQAAVWHLTDKLSWDDLAAKRIEHLNAASEPYFTHAQLQAARDAVEKAVEKPRDLARQASGERDADVAAAERR